MKNICGVFIVSIAHLYRVQLTVPVCAVYCLSKSSVGWRIAPCSVANTSGSSIFQLCVCAYVCAQLVTETLH